MTSGFLIENDLNARHEIWNALHVLWLDTDVDMFYFEASVQTCAASAFSLDELSRIYWREVYPLMRFNLMPWQVAGDWQPYELASLSNAIIKQRGFGRKIRFKRRRRYAYYYWTALSKAVTALRRPE